MFKVHLESMEKEENQTYKYKSIQNHTCCTKKKNKEKNTKRISLANED